MTRRTSLDLPRAGTRERPPFTIVVEQTPHPSLSPNRREHERVKARHRKALREASYLAAHNALVSRPEMAQGLRVGRLRLSYRVCWESSRTGHQRQRWDDDGLIGGGLKGVRDGICQKLGRDDADVETGTVEQEFSDARQGHIIVTIDQMEGATRR